MAEEQNVKQVENKIVRPVIEWPARMRASLAVLILTFLIAAMVIVLKNDLVNKKIDEVQDLVLDYVGKNGFSLQDIILTGRNRTTLVEVQQALGLKRGDNLLKLDIRKIKQNLETLPWVRDVEVRASFFPNVLKIEIKEKEVLAIWQLNEKFYPLDMDGYVIEADYRPIKPMLLVVGEGAAENILPFLKMVAEVDKSYLSRIKVANYISQRRWNIILDDIRNGITIKLPEENVEQAWKKLLKLDNKKGILKRKLTIIDLRLEGKVTVKLRKTKLKNKAQEHDL